VGVLGLEAGIGFFLAAIGIQRRDLNGVIINVIIMEAVKVTIVQESRVALVADFLMPTAGAVHVLMLEVG